ncbi:hypothetical protein KUTeg_009236 [Tegillarca granosa]|uniref:Uncharacterized protein n=1 Tax=Tegillarca granosa TaxID=220873 RepID=A0ABQ9FBI4_TEGGR|nr:hypothetical protein KUTeg_009236 [Tegillarca granosa]
MLDKHNIVQNKNPQNDHVPKENVTPTQPFHGINPKPVSENLLKNQFSSESRFVDVSPEDVEQFIAQHENENTKRKTQSHLKLLYAFMKSQNEFKEIHEIEPSALDSLLVHFFVSVRQSGGSEYEPTTLRGMLGSFERELKHRNYGESLITSVNFTKCRNTPRSKQIDLKKQGLGINQKQPIE